MVRAPAWAVRAQPISGFGGLQPQHVAQPRLDLTEPISGQVPDPLDQHPLVHREHLRDVDHRLLRSPDSRAATRTFPGATARRRFDVIIVTMTVEIRLSLNVSVEITTTGCR